jgi:hypothetical protein
MRTNRAAQNAKGTIVTSKNYLGRRARIMAGVMLVTAAASVTGLLGATAPANAATDAYIALAVGDVNDAPPVRTAEGSAIGPDQDQINGSALSTA